MPNEDNNPEYGAPPPAGGSLTEPRGAAPRAAPGLRLAVCLLLGAAALYLFRPAGLPPGTAAVRVPPPGEGSAPGVQVPPGAPERAAPLAAGGIQAESLTPPRGVPPEENFAPPAAGLLVPLRPFDPGALLEKPAETYQLAALAKETAEDRAGCKAGDMFKCLRLGGRYYAGHGVAKDDERAFSLINKACAGGVAEACTTQGFMQTLGHGTAQDVPAGIALYEKACSAGDMFGCSLLGSVYLEGRFAPADPPRAVGLFRKACGAKVAVACSVLGMLYSEGRGVPRDPAEAERLLGIACELNDKNSCQLREQLVNSRAAAGERR
ncbi:MAG: hypothetical protein NTY45_15345 [Elusimicrobia bacterium]|nr:hypothetical protein [Elusimicrobiota bacterium]